MKRSDGYYCFYCNARVDEEAEQCPKCGREFSKPGERPKTKPAPLGTRVRLATRGRQHGYRFAVIALLVVVVLLVVLFRPRKAGGPVLPEPTVSKPSYRIIETRDLPARGADRLSVVALVRPDMEQDSLRAVLDWVLHSMLDEHNRLGKRCLRVIWAYVLEDSTVLKSSWRAMAIWTDPKLPKGLRPAGIGGDAVKQGTVEYDFTNPVAPVERERQVRPKAGR